ncbi:MAG: O-antigen ligase family protein [Planctomycetota bacterium]
MRARESHLVLEHRLHRRVHVLSLLVFTPVLALPFLHHLGICWAWSYPKLFALQLAAALAWAGLLLILPVKLDEMVRASGIGMPMLVLVAWAGASTVWSSFPWMAAQPMVELIYGALAVVGLANLLTGTSTRRWFTAAYGIAAGGAAVAYVIAAAAAKNHMRVYPFANPNVAASFMIGPLAVGAAFALSAVRRRSRVRAGLLGAAAAVPCGWALVATRSDAGLAAGAGALVLVVVLSVGARLRRILVETLIGLAVLALLWPMLAPGLWPEAQLREAMGPRPGLWKGAARLAAERPATGLGVGTFLVEFADNWPREYAAHREFASFVRNAHCLPLHVLVELGVVGLGLAAWLLYRVIRNVRRAGLRGGQADRVLLRGLVCGGLGMLAHGLVSTSLHQQGAYANLILVLALIGGMATITWQHRAVGRRPPVLFRLLLALGVLAAFGLTAGRGLLSQYEMHRAWATPAHRYNERIDHLRRAIHVGWPSSWTLQARIELAKTYHRSGHVSDALDELDDAEALAPHFGRVERYRAELLLERGELRAATDALIDYCEKDPFSRRAYQVWIAVLDAAPPEDRAAVGRPDAALRFLNIASHYNSPRLPRHDIFRGKAGEAEPLPGIYTLRRTFVDALRKPER